MPQGIVEENSMHDGIGGAHLANLLLRGSDGIKPRMKNIGSNIVWWFSINYRPAVMVFSIFFIVMYLKSVTVVRLQ